MSLRSNKMPRWMSCFGNVKLRFLRNRNQQVFTVVSFAWDYLCLPLARWFRLCLPEWCLPKRFSQRSLEESKFASIEDSANLTSLLWISRTMGRCCGGALLEMAWGEVACHIHQGRCRCASPAASERVGFCQNRSCRQLFLDESRYSP